LAREIFHLSLDWYFSQIPLPSMIYLFIIKSCCHVITERLLKVTINKNNPVEPTSIQFNLYIEANEANASYRNWRLFFIQRFYLKNLNLYSDRNDIHWMNSFNVYGYRLKSTDRTPFLNILDPPLNIAALTPSKFGT
jgi:hypothetical protein